MAFDDSQLMTGKFDSRELCACLGRAEVPQASLIAGSCVSVWAGPASPPSFLEYVAWVKPIGGTHE